MGEVWRATDTKLGRDAAIKILPDSFAQVGQRFAALVATEGAGTQPLTLLTNWQALATAG